MNSKITTAFDRIRAEEDLKSRTIKFLRLEMQNKNGMRRRAIFKRFSYAAAFLIILFSGLFSHNVYFTESAYIDLEINPAVEFSINRFDRVIEIYAYNPDGEEIIGGLNVLHKSYDNALKMLIDAAVSKGYMQDEGLVSITLQAKDKRREEELLANIKTSTETSVNEHEYSSEINVFPVNDNVRNSSHELNMSPAKYLAILELQEVDPTVTFESCSSHTISEINYIVKNHGTRHHGNPITDAEKPDDAMPAEPTQNNIEEPNENYNNEELDIMDKNNGHHGHKGGHKFK